MTRHKTPSKRDRERLETINEVISEGLLECSCGENEACDMCNFDLSEEVYVYYHSADTLELGIRLKDIDSRSQLARRYNKDDEFADIVDFIEEEMDTLEDLDRVREAADLIHERNFKDGETRYPGEPIQKTH